MPPTLPHTPVRMAEEVALSPRGAQAVRDMPTDPFAASSSPVGTPAGMVSKRHKLVIRAGCM